MDSASSTSPPTALAARRVSLIWLGWLLAVGAIGAFWVPSLRESFHGLANPRPETQASLDAAYISSQSHALYHLTLDLGFVLASWAVAALILRRHPVDRLAISSAFALVLWAPTSAVVVESVPGGTIGPAFTSLGWLSCLFLFGLTWRASRSAPPLPVQLRLRWLWYGAAISLILLIVCTLAVGSNLTLAEDEIDRRMTGHLLLVLSGSVLLMAMTAAWLRPTIPDPDTLIRRTFVYGGLTSIVVGVSVCLVIIPAFFYPALGPVYVIAVGTAWAIGGLSVQQFLQRTVNRLLYGQRDEPMSVLNDLGQRLELGSPETVLTTMVETMATTLKLPAIAIRASESNALLASVGESNLEPLSLQIVHQRQEVGQLIVYPRARDELLHEHDFEILRIIARQAGPTVHAVQLNQELRRSRQQILAGREEERRRIRRDLHDGLGPALAAIAMQADTARAVLDDDPGTARDLLTAVTRQAEDVVHEVRRLVYDLRPPALDELGLAGAIARLAAQHSSDSLRIHVSATDEVAVLDAASEVAVYRIVAEALTNVVRHSQAHSCTITINEANGAQLATTVEDDGVGVGDDSVRGIGLRSMHDRAAEVGGELTIERAPSGGTRVTVSVPVSSAGEAEKQSDDLGR